VNGLFGLTNGKNGGVLTFFLEKVKGADEFINSRIITG
jgi:hypothetical protein